MRIKIIAREDTMKHTRGLDLLEEHKRWAKILGHIIVAHLQGNHEALDVYSLMEIEYKNCEPALKSDAISKTDRCIGGDPDLLGACKEAFNYLDKPYTSKYGNVEIINLLKQAISKAEGRQ